jgi:hypothetical protein
METMVKKDDNDDKKPKMRSMPRRDPKLKLGTRPMMPKTTSTSMTPRTKTMMPGEADGDQRLKKRSKWGQWGQNAKDKNNDARERPMEAKGSRRGQNEANEDKNAKDKKNDARERPMEAKGSRWGQNEANDDIERQWHHGWGNSNNDNNSLNQ